MQIKMQRFAKLISVGRTYIDSAKLRNWKIHSFTKLYNNVSSYIVHDTSKWGLYAINALLSRH